ncbi:agmatinase [Malassezia vespertilionis]|uniref:agmatinase n=1 Tax=Malassezia vespertilionis TaxID=2020962 RepID=UPI0024B1A828|nr:agmatinase [Malassezia vespertilionis]WFD06139.1 agmatinase [Malassezia vespertilionis]
MRCLSFALSVLFFAYVVRGLLDTGSSFARLPLEKCLVEDVAVDIAVLGVPGDITGSSRNKFSPQSIRAESAVRDIADAFNPILGINPYLSESKIVDCGNIGVGSLDQFEEAYGAVLQQSVPTGKGTVAALRPRYRKGTPLYHAKDGKTHPRVALMSSNESSVLPALRALGKVYEQITVLHFGARLGTSGGSNPLYQAAEEGLLSNSSIHVGLQAPLHGKNFNDYERDSTFGFTQLEVWELEKFGVDGFVDMIRKRVRSMPVYVLVDMDVLHATAFGTGLSMRELRAIVRGVSGVSLVGVEVAGAGVDAAEAATAAATIIYDLFSMMTLYPLDKMPLMPEQRSPRSLRMSSTHRTDRQLTRKQQNDRALVEFATATWSDWAEIVLDTRVFMTLFALVATSFFVGMLASTQREKFEDTISSGIYLAILVFMLVFVVGALGLFLLALKNVFVGL